MRTINRIQGNMHTVPIIICWHFIHCYADLQHLREILFFQSTVEPL